MSISGQRPVPWAAQMRLLHDGEARKAEWMAPEAVVLQVRSDYLNALKWLHDSALKTWKHQWTNAPQHLSGKTLRQHQQMLRQMRENGMPMCLGILRAVHQVEVRYFSEDGEHCLVIDSQTLRRMATYDADTQERIHTQDLGACAMVHEMVYDVRNRRWKINAFVQQLPLGWGSPRLAKRIDLFSELSAPGGRDN